MLDPSAFSRTGAVSPMGTLIDELKTKVDPDTAAMFRKLVHDKTFTEIQIEAAKVKREALFGKGPNGGTLLRGNRE